MMRCATPISWLRLERYHLDELPADGAKEVRAHVKECAACRRCLESIAGKAARPLRPLPGLAPVASPAPAAIPLRPARHRPWIAAGASVLALAACLMLILRRPPQDDGLASPRPTGNAVKGGEVAFTLVSEDGSTAVGDTLTFREGERFHARVTCPPVQTLAVGIAVYTGQDVDVPIWGGEIACGNGVDVPGAFRLTGRETMRICLVHDASGAPMSEARVRGGRAGVEMICKSASPVSD